MNNRHASSRPAIPATTRKPTRRLRGIVLLWVRGNLGLPKPENRYSKKASPQKSGLKNSKS